MAINRRGFLATGLATGLGLAADRLSLENLAAQGRQRPAEISPDGWAMPRDFQIPGGASMLEQLAYSIMMHVPRTKADGINWGWDITIFELCAGDREGHYMIIGHSEDEPGDPRQDLVTVLDLGSDPQFAWKRTDNSSYLVGNQQDPNFMKLYFRQRPSVEINNLPRFNNQGQRNVEARTEQEVLDASSLLLNPDAIRRIDSHASDQMELYVPSLYGKSGAHTITTFGSTGNGRYGQGRFNSTVYRVEDDNEGRPTNKQKRKLAGEIETLDSPGSANGVMRRIDELSELTPNEHTDLVLMFRKPDGNLDWRYKILSYSDEGWARETRFYRDDIAASRGTIPAARFALLQQLVPNMGRDMASYLAQINGNPK